MTNRRYGHQYNRLDESLHKISKSLGYSNDNRISANKELKDVLFRYLLPEMLNKDELFSKLFRKFLYSGSSFENLRIKERNEFDLNLDLKLPRESVEVESCQDQPGFMKIKCTARSGIEKWISSDGFIIRDNILCWLQSVVDKALRSISINGVKITRKTSGPAVTLKVNYNGRNFSVDLVPVFIFGKDQWLSPRTHTFSEPSAQEWYSVPKAPHFNAHNTHWRMSFYSQEKVFLNNLNTCKNVIKLMKFLRDKEGWHHLSSYYIKTVFMWVREKHPDSFWNQSLGIVFMHMLSEFSLYLKNKKQIPFFWNERLNLLSHLDIREVEKIGNRIDIIKKKIDKKLESNPEEIDNHIYCVFGVLPQRSDTNSEESFCDQENSSSLSALSRSSSSFEMIATTAVTIAAVAFTAELITSVLQRVQRRND